MSEQNQLATAPVNPGFHKATSALSATLGIEPRMMVDTLKKQCFPGQQADNITDAQLAAFVSVANALQLNPLVPGMLYAYPSKNGGIVPVTGPDGVFKVLDEQISNGKIDGYECTVFPADVTQKPTHAEAVIWRKNSERPSKFVALFSEWVVPSNPNWGTRPRHMLWLRAIKQCARQVIHGIPYDEDEVTIGDLKDVTPTAAPAGVRPPPPARVTKGAAAVKENAAPVVAPEPPVTKAAPLEVVAEVVQMPEPAPVPAPAPKPVAPVAPVASVAPKPAASKPVAPPASTGRTSLSHGETITAVVTVAEFKKVIGKRNGADFPYVSALVDGEFKGEVIHTDGSIDSLGQPVSSWQIDREVKLTLKGELKAGRVRNFVQIIEEIAASTDSTDDV